MTAFPRTILPVEVTELAMPGPLISKAQSGRVNIRSTQQIGRTWSERYLLKVTNTVDRGFLATVRNLWRNGTIFDIGHVDYATPKGAGGGTPLVNSTQVLTAPENFGTWTVSGTPVLTAGQSDPLGTSLAYLVADDDAAVNEQLYLVTAFTGDGVKAMSIYMKAGTSTQSTLSIFDSTAGTHRHAVNVVWTAGVPSLSTNTGSGTLYPVELITGAWYRISFNANGVVAANTNRCYVIPTIFGAAATGSVYVFGANAWNSPYTMVYRSTSGGAAQTGNRLVIDGASASVTNWLRAGDIFSVAGLGPVYEVTADTSTVANGHAQIPINPPIFTGGAPADNAALTISGVTMSACIVAPPEFPRSTGQGADYGELTLQFSEVL